MLTINSERNSEDFKSRNIILSFYILFFMFCDLYLIKANTDSDITNDILLYKHSKATNYFLITINAIDLILSIFLLKWKKWAFWLLTLTSTISVFLSIYLDKSLLPIIGFFYIIALFALLQLKKNNITGWNRLN